MSNILALDIGTKRTGVAYGNTTDLVPLPLEVIKHRDELELSLALKEIIKTRHINEIVVGLPLLLSGDEGKQAKIIKQTIPKLNIPLKIKVTFIDERFTTPQEPFKSPDAAAATHILQIYLDKLIG